MKILLRLFLCMLVLASGRLPAFYSIAEMNADALRKDASIRIRISNSGDQITFIVALRSSANNQEVYWHGSLGLVAPSGLPVASIEMRGEDIRRALPDSTLRKWGWQDYRPAEVFRFTVASNMLAQSRFVWETGPRNDEHGIDYGGGIVRWSSLQALAAASEDANKTAQRTGASRSAQETNRTSSAAGSRR